MIIETLPDNFLNGMPVPEEEEEFYMSTEQDYYYEELVAFMQSLPKKAIFDTYKF